MIIILYVSKTFFFPPTRHSRSVPSTHPPTTSIIFKVHQVVVGKGRRQPAGRPTGAYPSVAEETKSKSKWSKSRDGYANSKSDDDQEVQDEVEGILQSCVRSLAALAALACIVQAVAIICTITHYIQRHCRKLIRLPT